MTTTTEAELVARIAEDPDDRASFLVYGDWLQQHGDPRGLLVSLQATGRDAAAERLLATQAELLGPLVAYPNVLAVDWHCGFVRVARIAIEDVDHALRVVEDVMTAPACRFLRRLEVVMRRSRAYDQIDALLARIGVPRTLDELVLGAPLEHVPSAALLAAFPRIAAPAERWREIAVAVSELEPFALRLDPAELPPLPVPLSPAVLLQGLLADTALADYGYMTNEMPRPCKLGLVALLRAVCNRAVLDRYAVALVERTYASRAEMLATSEIAVALGGARTARGFANVLVDQPSIIAKLQVLDCLRNMTSPSATLELFDARRRISFAALDRGGPTPDRLARAGSAPDTSEPELVAHYAALDLDVLDHLVATGWTTTLRDAVELFEQAPRAARAAALVWGRTRHTVRRRLLRDDRHDVEPFFLGDRAALGIPQDEQVWLVHPAELDDAALEYWRAFQRTRGPAVPQLDRRLVLWPRERPTLAGLHAALDPFPTYATILRRRGYLDVDPAVVEPPLMIAYRYRDSDYAFDIDVAARRVEPRDDEVPAVVLHELACDLIGD